MSAPRNAGSNCRSLSALGALFGLLLLAGPAAALDGAPVDAGDGRVLQGALGRGDTLSAALRRQGISPQTIGLISAALSPFFDFRHAQAGHVYELVRGAQGELIDFRYRVSDFDCLHLFRQGEGFAARREEADLEARVSRIAGVISSTLYEAVQALGESAQLAVDFTDILAWDVDFSRSVQPGDEFRILYERLYHVDADTGSEVYVRPGRILAAHYVGAGGRFTAVYFEDGNGRSAYYRPDGSPIERTFLLAPLRYTHISSSFSNARRHPILKITRPHHGIDYAALAGTPIWAVADGEIIYRGRAGGFGNLVKIRHAKGYISYYAHLSRFPNGLRVGQKVEQKQVVGYVGQTGLATGPHVCFRITHDGRYVDPLSLRSPAAAPVQMLARHEFEGTRDSLLAELGTVPLFGVDEAL